MGIPGLWAELAPAAETTTLHSYLLTSFVQNRNELRGLRLGIDASLWLFHALQSSGGANPHLRLLFYRLAKLLSLPVLPVFVFDGPKRPTWKRGKLVSGRQQVIEEPFSYLIEAFGYQWHRAPGEAEAELAYLNQVNLIDAVLTDDSDALLFGAHVVIRNWGKNLSGTMAFSRTTSTSGDMFDQAAASTQDITTASAASRPQLSGPDGNHLITLYNTLELSNPYYMGLDRDALILIGLMSGGDYDTTGLLQCGIKIAVALARSGFGYSLNRAFKASYTSQESASHTCPKFERFLKTWRENVREELRTNKIGFLPSKRPKLASTIPNNFLSTPESRKVLAYYLYPLTSQSNKQFDPSFFYFKGGMAEPDLKRLARLTQIYFKWSKEAILSKFRTILGPGVVVRRLRQESLEITAWTEEQVMSWRVRQQFIFIDVASVARRVSVSTTQQKSRALHDSPNATRITDFFAKAAIATRPCAGTAETVDHLETSLSSLPAFRSSVKILAIKMQRRHAALDPFRDFRVLVPMEEFAELAQLGIDDALDTRLASERMQGNESDTDRLGDQQEDTRTRPKSGMAGKRPDPGSPLLMWIAEPLLELSTSGAGPLHEFLDEVEKKAAAAQAKELRKKAATEARSKANQTTLSPFIESSVKPSLRNQVKATPKGPQSSDTSSKRSSLVQESTSGAVEAPHTPRQLRVPSGMQRSLRRTESVPVPIATTDQTSAGFAAPAPCRGRGQSRHISLPDATSALMRSSDADGEEADSSIEFLGAVVSDRLASGGAGHSRAATPPRSTSNGSEEQRRPNKSPRKLLTPAPHRTTTSRSTPSQRALAEPVIIDSEDSDCDDHDAELLNAAVKPFSTRLAESMAQ